MSAIARCAGMAIVLTIISALVCHGLSAMGVGETVQQSAAHDLYTGPIAKYRKRHSPRSDYSVRMYGFPYTVYGYAEISSRWYINPNVFSTPPEFLNLVPGQSPATLTENPWLMSSVAGQSPDSARVVSYRGAIINLNIYFVLCTVVCGVRQLITNNALRSNQCRKCKYPLVGLRDKVCPECGSVLAIQEGN